MPVEFDPQAMDTAALEAKHELDDLPTEQVAAMAEWWHKWYLTAGHKRLGRILVNIGKEMTEE